MEKLVIQKRTRRKKKQTCVTARIDIDTYQKIEDAANKCNYSIIEMTDTLINYAIKNLEIREAE